jgi:SAM-dependent methyltransferase
MAATDDRMRWDKRYAASPSLAALSPAPLLLAHERLLPRAGRALDVACGAGRHALFLAARGLRTLGVDVSPEGLRLARNAALARRLSLDLVAADLSAWTPPAATFDVVTCIHYLERSIFPAIAAALRPGGVLVFETFTRDQLAFPEAHPRREEFLLAPNELLRAFPSLHVLHFEEGVRILEDGSRAVLATLFAERRSE